MTSDRPVTVCSFCLTAACWAGLLPCEQAHVALTRQMLPRELRPLRREPASNWTLPEIDR